MTELNLSDKASATTTMLLWLQLKLTELLGKLLLMNFVKSFFGTSRNLSGNSDILRDTSTELMTVMTLSLLHRSLRRRTNTSKKSLLPSRECKTESMLRPPPEMLVLLQPEMHLLPTSRVLLLNALKLSQTLFPNSRLLSRKLRMT